MLQLEAAAHGNALAAPCGSLQRKSPPFSVPPTFLPAPRSGLQPIQWTRQPPIRLCAIGAQMLLLATIGSKVEPTTFLPQKRWSFDVEPESLYNGFLRESLWPPNKSMSTVVGGFAAPVAGTTTGLFLRGQASSTAAAALGPNK